MRGSTLSGAASDQALVEAVRAAGNVILLADATYNADTGESPAMADTGFAPAAAGAVQRRVVYPPFAALAHAGSALGHNFFVLDPDGPLRHTVPFAQAGTHACRRSASPPRSGPPASRRATCGSTATGSS